MSELYKTTAVTILQVMRVVKKSMKKELGCSFVRSTNHLVSLEGHHLACLIAGVDPLRFNENDAWAGVERLK